MIDRAKFVCSGIPHSDLVTRPSKFLTGLDFETFDVGYGTRTRKGRSSGRSRTIKLLPEQIIRLFLYKEGKGEWRLKSVEFNPLKLLDGHNGNPNHDFRESLTELREILRHLLADPDDVDTIIPGLPGSSSYWKSLELVRHVPRTNLLLSAFQAGRHPDIRSVPSIYPGESIRFGNKNSALSLTVYDKNKEACTRRGKYPTPDGQPEILRLEARLQSEQLLRLLGKAVSGRSNLARIDGTKRLIKFTRADCLNAHRHAFEDLKGVYAVHRMPGSTKDKIPRYIANVHRQHGIPVQALMELYVSTAGGELSDNQRNKLRAAVEKELETTSPVVLSKLLATGAADMQLAISIPELEIDTRKIHTRKGIYGRILTAYGEPDELPKFVPHVDHLDLSQRPRR